MTHPVNPSRPAPIRPRPRAGFALLATITLVAFLVLILVSLATLTRVETQVATNSQQLARARQHALMALNLALGQLQRHTGPDQRVTAAADLAAAADGTRLPAGSPARNTTSVNGAANGLNPVSGSSIQTGARWWTGVWGRSGPSYSVPGASIYEETPAPVLLNWLVSGNENQTFTIDADGLVASSDSADGQAPFTPGMSINWSAAGLDPAAPAGWSGGQTYADLEIKAAGQKAVLLVGPATAGVDPVAGEIATERYVVAPLRDIDVPSASVGLGATGDTTVGRYAWWVGDEGLKASYALADPHAGQTDPVASAPARVRLMSAARSGIELVPGWQDYPDANDTQADVKFDRVLDLQQAPMLTASLTAENRRAGFHDFTRLSNGLLTDTLRGGLRRDLTHDFETASAWNTSPLKGQGIIPAPWSPDWGGGELAPKWDWLYSFYNTNPSVADPSLPVRPETATEVGVIPIITQFRAIFFTDPDLLGPDPKVDRVPPGDYRLPIRCNVVFVLANPYNVELTAPADTYEFSIKNTRANNASSSTRPAGLSIIVAENTNTPPDASVLLANPAGETAPSMLDAVRFTLPAFSIPPGETRVFSVRGNDQVAGGVAPPAVTGTEQAVELELNDATNPVTSADGDPADRRYFTAASTLDFTTTRARTFMFLNFNDAAFFTITLRQTAAAGGSALQRLADAAVSKKNAPLGAQENEVFGNLHVKFIPPARRDLDASSPGEKSRYALHVYARSFQDLNLRAGVIDLPAVSDTARVRTPTSYSGGFSRSTYQPIPGEFSQDLVPVAPWIENFDLQTRSPVASKGVLFDFPRRAAGQPPVLSIGQLQHASLSTDDWHPGATVHYQPAYAVGNSYHNPFVTRGQAMQSGRPVRFHGAPANATRYFDLAYLLNTALWDGYFFSGVPATGAAFEPTNPRYTTRGEPAATDLRAPDSAAHLLVKGAFNINSTSHSAWVALLGGLNALRVHDDPAAQGAPFPRTLWQPEHNTLTGSSYQPSGTGDDAHAGYRRLNLAEIDALATEIVKRVRARGPFVSLSHFINRSLVAASPDFNPLVNDADPAGNLAANPVPMGRGLAGPLQAAIDHIDYGDDDKGTGINAFQTVGGDRVTAKGAGDYGDRVLFGGEPLGISQSPPYSNNEKDYYADKVVDLPNLNPFFDEEAPPGPQGRTSTGLPGWLLQGDILQALGPALSARSDTFVIRAYGEALNPADPTDRQAAAWCEALVQRLPDYVDPAADAPAATPASLSATNRTHGRAYKIIAFRWLTADDI